MEQRLIEQYQKLSTPREDLPGIRAVPIYELMNIKFPPKEHLLSPWLTTQGIAMIYAPRGVGKTHVSLGIACAVATGSEFLGWQAPSKRSVLFIDGEMPGVQLQERIASILLGMGVGNTEGIPLTIITPDLQRNGLPDIASESGQRLIDSHIHSDTDLIIVDNLSTTVQSGKENEAEGWLPIQKWALKHRAKGRTVLFIHHAGKNGQQRGTSRREDALDTVIALKRPSDYSPEQGACFEMHYEKARGLHGEALAPFLASLSDDNGASVWEKTPLEESTFEKVIELAKMEWSQSEIAHDLQVNKSTVSRHIKHAKEQGRL